MHTGFDMLSSSDAVRRHWFRRFVAGFVDVTIVFLPVWLLIFFVDIPEKAVVIGLGSGAAWFVYSTLLEGRYGRTVGKQLVHLKVVSMQERRTYHQSFIRSIPKLFWFIFLPFDVIIGLATEGDPRKRWTDGLARTMVIAYYTPVPRDKKTPPSGSRMQRKEQGLKGSKL
jgi:uncharacterized RDD family membrane protein YckC